MHQPKKILLCLFLFVILLAVFIPTLCYASSPPLLYQGTTVTSCQSVGYDNTSATFDKTLPTYSCMYKNTNGDTCTQLQNLSCNSTSSGGCGTDKTLNNFQSCEFTTPFTLDQCNQCGPLQSDDRNTCLGCDNVPNSGKLFDDCGVCLDSSSSSWNSTCVDCKGTINGGYATDDCGECSFPGSNEWNSSCKDCAGVVNGSHVIDDCEQCLNPSDSNFNKCTKMCVNEGDLCMYNNNNGPSTEVCPSPLTTTACENDWCGNIDNSVTINCPNVDHCPDPSDISNLAVNTTIQIYFDIVFQNVYHRNPSLRDQLFGTELIDKNVLSQSSYCSKFINNGTCSSNQNDGSLCPDGFQYGHSDYNTGLYEWQQWRSGSKTFEVANPGSSSGNIFVAGDDEYTENGTFCGCLKDYLSLENSAGFNSLFNINNVCSNNKCSQDQNTSCSNDNDCVPDCDNLPVPELITVKEFMYNNFTKYVQNKNHDARIVFSFPYIYFPTGTCNWMTVNGDKYKNADPGNIFSV